MLRINKDHSASEVEVKRGELLEIELPENPTTGYRWRLRCSGEPILEVQDDSFLPSGGPSGAGGVRRWRFLARQEGTTKIEMEYQRSWEQRALETFWASVRVVPDSATG